MVVESASQQPVKDRDRTASGGRLDGSRIVLRGGRVPLKLRCTTGGIVEEIGVDFTSIQEWRDYLDYGEG